MQNDPQKPLSQTAALEYHITSVTDFLQVPEERRTVCLREFGVWLSIGEATTALMDGIPVEWPSTFVWVDDDKHEATVGILTGEEHIEIAKGRMREFANG